VPVEQIVRVVFAITGVGLTTTETVNGVPVHGTVDDGVTLYATVIGEFVVFVNVPEIELELVPVAKPEIPLVVGAAQVYVVPVGTIFPLPFDGDTVNGVPEQTVVVCVVVTFGIGFTVTVTGKLAPGQTPDKLGVTVYTTLIGAFVVFVNVPVIAVAFAVEVAVPVIPVTVGADQA